MALTELVHALEREAADQIRALLDTAASRATQLEADAARRSSEECAGSISACADECRAKSDELRATAQRMARANVLAARAAMLDRVRSALLAQLPAYTTRVGVALARAAIGCAGTRAGVLRCPPELLATVAALAPPSLRVEAANVGCGVVIELASGTQIVATLEALVDREWPTLAAAVVALANEGVTS